jgi:hypothetical protein
MSALAAIAAWLQPALVAVLAFRVTAGEADAPWLTLAALVAPLVALLAPARPSLSNPVTAAVAGVTVALLLAADFLVAAEAATLLGAPRWQGIALAALPVIVIAAWPPVRRVSPGALAAAALLLLLAPAAVAVAEGGAPWSAWQRSGLRASLTFSERSPWVIDGERFARAATLRFTEGQRVVALTSGLYRVVERDTARPTVREWRLSAGEALTLRPGDELTVEAGARMRFEAGRRVPGAPASGVQWADAPSRGPRLLPGALGALMTLLGGALALVPAARRGWAAAAGPLVLLAAVAAVLAWGVYAAAAPDLVLGGAIPAPLLRLPALALGARAGAPLALLTVVALVAMLATAAVALRERLAATASPSLELWIATVVVATALAVAPLDPWRVLTLGLGLAASAWAPARLAASPAGALAGPIVGGVAFLALAALPAVAPGAAAWLDALARYPSLVALPLGWLAARAMPGDGDREPQVG